MKTIILLPLLLLASTLSFGQKSNKLKEELYIGAGLAFNSFRVTGDDSYLETKIDHTVPVRPAFVGGARFYTDNKTERFFLAPGIAVYSFSAKGSVDIPTGISTYNHSSSYSAKMIIAPSASVGYHVINTPGIKWYFLAGFGLNFPVNSNETQITTYVNTTQRIIINKAEPMIFVFNTGTGVDIGKNVNLWLNYQPPADITKYKGKKSMLASLQAGLSWFFRKGK